MKFGLVSLVDYHPGKGLTQAERLAQLVEMAVVADELGFDSFWVGEHHFNNYIASNPIPILGAMAARTKRIRLGTGVALPAHHDALHLAEDYATIDVLSNGRLDYVGSRGVFKNAFAGFNQDFAERGERMWEALDVMRGAWTSESFSYDGRFTKCRNLTVQPRPVQTPHPPIWVGCSAIASARMAAEKGFNLSLFDFPGLIDPVPLITAYRERIRELGKDPAQHKISMGRHGYIRATQEQARAEFEPYYRNYFSMGGPDGSDAINRQAAQGPVVPQTDGIFSNALCTDPETAIRHIRGIRDRLGLDHYWLKVDMGAQENDRIFETLRVIAAKVLPEVRG